MCKKFYNNTVRASWNEGPNSDAAAAERDANARREAQAAAERLAAEEATKRETEANQRILDEAKENDRRRGRRATVISGVVGDPNYGGSVKTTSAYSLGAGATRLGG